LQTLLYKIKFFVRFICTFQIKVYFTIYDGRDTKKDALLRRLGDCTTLYLSKLCLICASKTRDCDTSLTALNIPRFNSVMICFNVMYSNMPTFTCRLLCVYVSYTCAVLCPLIWAVLHTIYKIFQVPFYIALLGRRFIFPHSLVKFEIKQSLFPCADPCRLFLPHNLHIFSFLLFDTAKVQLFFQITKFFEKKMQKILICRF